jgi:hypothetical protein
VVAAGLYVLALRDRQLRWGAMASEVVGSLPGDEFLPQADLVATRAIGVAAPTDRVWPWLAQMGQGRGGLYSYDWLENLVGCQIRSARRVVPEWQQVSVGDDVRIHPDVALVVVTIDPPHALVVRGGVTASGRPTGDESSPPYDFTWAFVLVPDGPEHTRLIIRERYLYLTPAARLLVETVSLASFVMTERMLRGIRDRAIAAR